jgi:hypothetical protein
VREYSSYLDSISLDAAQHEKIVRTLAQHSARRNLAWRRVWAAVVCIALTLLSFCLIPDRNDPLIFNQASLARSIDKANVAGYFTEELTATEIAHLLGKAWPLLAEDEAVSATAGFSGEGILYDLSLRAEVSDGTGVTVLLMPGPVELDYSYPDQPQQSNVKGVAVTAGYWDPQPGTGQQLYYASFVHEPVGYYIELRGDANTARNKLEELVNHLVAAGPPDLNQVQPDQIPEWRMDEITLSEAQSDPEFGDCVPGEIPAGFSWQSALRFTNQQSDGLRLTYSKGMNELAWTVTRATAEDMTRIADIDRPETYDLSLYPIPRANSVPEDLREIVENPVFRKDELSLGVVQSRTYTVEDAGDVSGPRVNFSVLWGDKIIQLRAKGLAAEDVLSVLTSIEK